jgi:hypothetical protein
MTRAEFLDTIQAAISPDGTLEDRHPPAAFHVQYASGSWTRTYKLKNGVVEALNHRDKSQDIKPDRFEDRDSLFEDLWQYEEYVLCKHLHQNGRASAARPKIIAPDQKEIVYAAGSDRSVALVERGDLHYELVLELDRHPDRLEADQTGRVYHVAANGERVEVPIEGDPIDQRD